MNVLLFSSEDISSETVEKLAPRLSPPMYVLLCACYYCLRNTGFVKVNSMIPMICHRLLCANVCLVVCMYLFSHPSQLADLVLSSISVFEDSDEASSTPVRSARSSVVSKASPGISSIKRGRESNFDFGDTILPSSPVKRSRVSPRKFVCINGVKYYADRSPSPSVEPAVRRPSPFPVRLDSTSPEPRLDSSNSPVTLPSAFPSATPISVRAEPVTRTSHRRVRVPRSRSSSYEMPDISEFLQSRADPSKHTPSPKKRIAFASPSPLPPPPSVFSSPSTVSKVSRSAQASSSTGRALRDLQIREAMQTTFAPAESPDAVDTPSSAEKCVYAFLLIYLAHFFP